ncbi:MAG TPA: hypothetical protein H9913_08875 [Candidatus Blautia stercoripullorum]|uniref:Uncharacterized protein n=2 Tax=Blautia TaxID=572511 RepID=A0A9D2U634_9FIRM|nr:hypothetical protein [Candidatus Blautia stercorigallinarum]HJD40128.1 hypothetical protein [Candidatus Blautia stercoripullorum]
MGVKQDYLMRMINDVVRGLALVLTGQREVRYELPVEEERTEEEKLYARILEMADRGEINEAENILLGDFPENTPGYGIMVADFYQHLDEFEDDFLEEHDYSREEVLEGLESLAEEYGLTERS